MKRYLVLVALFFLALIAYVDRACISSTKEPLAHALALSDSAMGLVFGAFALGYALAQIPAGWFADKTGPRLTLVLIVSLWSVLTTMTGASLGLLMLLTVRFLVGVAEAGVFPSSARAIYNWLPKKERGLANGVVFSGSRIGAALAFPLLAYLLKSLSWRVIFGLLGALGLSWVGLWTLFSRNLPGQAHTELGGIAASGAPKVFGQILRSRRMALTMTQYFASNFTFFIALSWMYPYLKSHYSLSSSQAATFTMFPLLFGASAQWLSGFLVDFLYRHNFGAQSRRLPAIAGFLLSACAVLAVTQAGSALEAEFWFCLSTFGCEMTISPSWAYCIDMGKAASGVVSASMNMAGNLGAFVSANAFPLLQHLAGNSSAFFKTAAFLDAVAIFCWFWMQPEKRSRNGEEPDSVFAS
jgi:ACS family glucarate transporter-like MFS transporter